MPRLEIGQNEKTGLSGLENVKALKIAAIDEETSATILAGFTYEAGGEQLHFSYKSDDQQNFADAANGALLATISGQNQSVVWNGYRGENRELVRLELDVQQFLQLYAQGALAHKATCMEIGGQRKEAVRTATTVEEVEAA